MEIAILILIILIALSLVVLLVKVEKIERNSVKTIKLVRHRTAVLPTIKALTARGWILQDLKELQPIEEGMVEISFVKIGG